MPITRHYASGHNTQHQTNLYIYIYILLRNRSCRDVHEPETHVVATWTGYRDVAKSRQCMLSSNDSKRHETCKKIET
jgi:hypothetical protein